MAFFSSTSVLRRVFSAPNSKRVADYKFRTTHNVVNPLSRNRFFNSINLCLKNLPSSIGTGPIGYEFTSMHGLNQRFGLIIDFF
jgi:hypothetical protein